jgi:hypothetical protein
MPIRFRCAYCNQLLGISRRKAGTIVRCPTCAGQVVVPNVEAEDSDSSGSDRDPMIFERNDFDDLLSSGDGGAIALPKNETMLTSTEAPVPIPSVANPPPGAWGTHAEPAYDLEKLKPTPALFAQRTPMPPGIHLSPARATLVAIVFVVLLAIAFGAGVLVGFSIKASAPPVPSSRREPAPRRWRSNPSALARASIPDVLQGAVKRRQIERQPGNVSQLVVS